ncbi:MAG: hypothetical protein QOF08_332 [Gaiellales bacterium]|jgi:hypothetical protein|nr:hypothetical protein [Gaiellales bacterium]
MRRFLIVCLCLFTVGFVLLLVLAARGRGADGRLKQVDPELQADGTDPAEVEEAGVEQPVPGDVVALADRTVRTPDADPEPDRAGGEAELALERLVSVRAEVAAKVERKPLFVMAHARGLPNHELFTMTSEQLLEAILEAEGLPPADVLPSPQTEERVMAVVAEAHRRQEEYLAEEAAKRDAG